MNHVGRENGACPSCTVFFGIFSRDGQKEFWALTNHVFEGEVEVFIDGTSVLRATSLVLRDDPTSRIRGMHFQTFFGGVSISISSSYISNHILGINHLQSYTNSLYHGPDHPLIAFDVMCASTYRQQARLGIPERPARLVCLYHRCHRPT